MKTKIYVLILKDEDDFEDYPAVWGVFTTKEKAIKKAKKCIADKTDELSYMYKEENFSIEERELDGKYLTSYKAFNQNNKGGKNE